MVFMLKPGKDPTLPSSYRPISLLDTVGKLFEKILLNRVLKEVNERGLLHDEQFGFRPRLSTTLQLAHLVERVNRNLDKRRLTGAVFDTVWVEGLLYRLTVLNFPSYVLKTISSYGRSKRHSSQPHPPVAACGLCLPGRNCFPCAVQPVCKRRADAVSPRRAGSLRGRHGSGGHVRSPYLLVSYLEAYLCRLRDWRISVNVSKSTAMLFTPRRIHRPKPIQFLGEPVAWVETARYLGVTLDTRLTWSAHINQLGRKAAQRLGMFGALCNKRSVLYIRNGVLLYKQLIRPVMEYACQVWSSPARSHVRKVQVLQSKCHRIATMAHWYVGNRQIHEDLGIPFFRRPHQGINQELRLKVI